MDFVNTYHQTVTVSGKTMLVKSLVEQAPGTFINIKISDVMSGSIGEASSVIRNLFLEAKKRSPAVIFIDEFQALFTSRDENTRSDSGDSTLIFTLIGCLDDLSSWNSCSGPEFIVTVMAATNEPWAVDEILLRTGRFDKVVFVGPMSPRSRGEILKRLMVGIENAIPMDINENNVISKTERFTGADMNILFRKACSYYSDRNWITDASSVPVFNNTYFDRVLNEMESSCSIEEFAEYVKWGREFQSKIW
jgi:transitional endoplasmic reticulum ATPase